MPVPIRICVLIALVLTGQLVGTTTTYAGTLAEITDCSIESQTPSISLGAQARYVLHLFGGNGSYSISFAYGDGWVDGASVTASQATFSHWFQTTGTFTETAYVRSASSSASCTTQTVVW